MWEFHVAFSQSNWHLSILAPLFKFESRTPHFAHNGEHLTFLEMNNHT